MIEENKLTTGQKHLMRLVSRGRDAEGWAPVSHLVLPIMTALPSELVVIENTKSGGRARLTEAGEAVVKYL